MYMYKTVQCGRTLAVTSDLVAVKGPAPRNRSSPFMLLMSPLKAPPPTAGPLMFLMGGGGKGGVVLRAGCSLRTYRGPYMYEVIYFVRVGAPFPPPPLHLAVRWRNQQRAEKYVIHASGT